MSKGRQFHVFAKDHDSRVYLSPYVNAAAAEGRLDCRVDFARDADAIRALLDQDVTIWIDGFDTSAVELSQQPILHRARVICRIRGAEILDTDADACKWEFFDDLVISNRATDAMLFERFDRIESMTRVTALPPAAAIPTVNVARKQRTGRVAFVGPLRHDNNATLLIQIAAMLRRRSAGTKITVAGEFESTALQLFFETQIQALELAAQLEFETAPDNLTTWLADKDALIATAGTPQCEATMLQAMALGVQPVVNLYFGAEQTFPEAVLFAAADHAAEMLCHAPWQPQTWRKLASEKHDVARHLAGFCELIGECARPEAPKVSILLPTYNRSRLLQKTLTRLAQQTYRNLEIVVVNDCSPDDTDPVMQQVSQQMPQVRYVRNETNQGNAGAMATAARHADGEYVLVFSDDDDLADDAVEKFVEWRQRKAVDLIYCDLAITDTDGHARGEWTYRNYYANRDLQRDLLFADGNKIPEVFFCRRELYAKIYEETYSRRFLNTYYLPHLRRIKMIHLPEPLYRYAVHAGSTFSSTRGLFDRSKSTQNYVNAMMLMYSPLSVIDVAADAPLPTQVGQAFFGVACALLEHGRRKFTGTMYTGAEYDEADHLWYAYFYNAYHWLQQARKYLGAFEEYDTMMHKITERCNPAEFDPPEHACLPPIYQELPWFANKCFNNVSDFVVLDIATLGKCAWLPEGETEIHRAGKIRLNVRNHRCDSIVHLEQVLSENVISVVNIDDATLLEPLLRSLIEQHRFAVQVMNFTAVRVPELETIKNLYNCRAPQSLTDYLRLVTELTTLSSYADTTVTAAV